MANEICQAIDGVDFSRSEELLEAVTKVGDITGKTEYQFVSFENNNKTMSLICPENWLKFSNAYENFDQTED